MRPVVAALVLLAAGCSAASPPAPAATTSITSTTSTTSVVPAPPTTSARPEAATVRPHPVPPPPPPRTFTIAAAGDILVHKALSDVAVKHAGGEGYDFTPLFAPIRPWIESADFAICHFEGTLSPNNSNLMYQVGHTHPAYFNVPHEVTDAIAEIGFDACSTASNHALDRGSVGIRETLEVLEAAGLGHAGTARTPDERGPTFYRVNGVEVAHLSYTASLNRPAAQEWEIDVLKVDRVLADAAEARRSGAEFVILSLHWGSEYRSLPTGLQSAQAAQLLESPDIDLILGHHAHVVQPIDRVDGKVVVYGMGNLISNIRGLADGTKTGGEDGVIIHITVAETDRGFEVTGVSITPTWVTPVGKEVIPVAHTLAADDGPYAPYARALRISYDRTVARALRYRPEGVTVSPTPWPWLPEELDRAARLRERRSRLPEVP